MRQVGAVGPLYPPRSIHRLLDATLPPAQMAMGNIARKRYQAAQDLCTYICMHGYEGHPWVFGDPANDDNR